MSHFITPCRMTSASVIDCCVGLSMAFPRNCSTSPSSSSLIERASSCSGVLNISGVIWSGSLAGEQSISMLLQTVDYSSNHSY